MLHFPVASFGVRPIGSEWLSSSVRDTARGPLPNAGRQASLLARCSSLFGFALLEKIDSNLLAIDPCQFATAVS
jgi:hypothetical protein